MALEYFSGFDHESQRPEIQSPQLSQASERLAAELSGDTEPTQFDRDVADFVVASRRILEADAGGSITPVNSRWVGNTPQDPFDYSYMEKHLLRQRGYRLHAVDSATDSSGRALTGSVAWYADAADHRGVDGYMAEAFTLQFGENPHPLSEFLDDISDRLIYKEALDPKHPLYDDARGKLSALGNEQGIDHMVARGFMTSLVLTQVKTLQDQNRYAWGVSPGSEPKYAELTAEGVRPFNPEELYGIASSIMHYVFAENPNIPPPASKYPEQSEY